MRASVASLVEKFGSSTKMESEEDTLIHLAVMPDGSLLKLGSVKLCATTGMYHGTSGIPVPASEVGPDGTYTLDSGHYRLLTASQYAAVKRVEATDVGRATQALASMQVTPEHTAYAEAPVGCSMKAGTLTALAVGPRHIATGLARAKSALEIARKNYNRVVTVVLGVHDVEEAREALGITDERVLLAGANELRALRSGGSGRMRLYLSRAKLCECLAISKTSDRVVWLLPHRHVSLDGVLHRALVQRGNKTPAEWKDALNSQFSAWMSRFSRSDGQLDATDAVLLEAYLSIGSNEPPPVPLAGLGAATTALCASGCTPPFGGITHTILWRSTKRHSWPEPQCQWTTTGGSGSAYWAVATWCRKTSKHMPSAVVPRTRGDTLALKGEVEFTLASLLSYTAHDGERPFARSFDALKGVLGPVVFASHAAMRCVWWTVHGMPGGVLMLLPEAYVQHALREYAVSAPSLSGDLIVQGFLALSDADTLPLLPTVDQADDDDMLTYSARLWRCGETGVASGKSFQSMPELAQPLPTYRTFKETDAWSTRIHVRPGHELPGQVGQTVFYTVSRSDDMLQGLRVRWVRKDSSPHGPSLDVDTDVGGTQTLFERF